jgi:hypothetical protein
VRFWHFAVVVGAMWIAVGLVWGIDGAALYLLFALIALFFAWNSRREGRLSLRAALWTLARGAAFVGAAWNGLWTAAALIIAIVVLQEIGEAAEKAYLVRGRGRKTATFDTNACSPYDANRCSAKSS